MLSDHRDLVRMRDGVRRLREICLQPGVTDIADRADYGATGRAMGEPLSDTELDEWLFAECSDAQHAAPAAWVRQTTHDRWSIPNAK